jgi:hypothetical protein
MRLTGLAKRAAPVFVMCRPTEPRLRTVRSSLGLALVELDGDHGCVSCQAIQSKAVSSSYTEYRRGLARIRAGHQPLRSQHRLQGPLESRRLGAPLLKALKSSGLIPTTTF